MKIEIIKTPIMYGAIFANRMYRFYLPESKCNVVPINILGTAKLLVNLTDGIILKSRFFDVNGDIEVSPFIDMFRWLEKTDIYNLVTVEPLLTRFRGAI